MKAFLVTLIFALSPCLYAQNINGVPSQVMNGFTGATSSALGPVQLASGQTSTTLATVATTGAFGDLSGTSNLVLLNGTQTFTGVDTFTQAIQQITDTSSNFFRGAVCSGATLLTNRSCVTPIDAEGQNSSALQTWAITNADGSASFSTGKVVVSAAGLTTTTTLKVGTAAALTYLGLITSSSATPASIGANGCASTTYTFTGVPVGAVMSGLRLNSGTQGTNISFGGYDPVATTGSVSIRWCNVSVLAAQTPTAGAMTALFAW